MKNIISAFQYRSMNTHPSSLVPVCILFYKIWITSSQGFLTCGFFMNIFYDYLLSSVTILVGKNQVPPDEVNFLYLLKGVSSVIGML